jgi:drug/metabolite transporter (DMT)-like permease
MNSHPAFTPKISRNALAHLLLLAMTLIWGTMFVIVKRALVSIPPQWFNAFRMTLAFVCLAIVYRSQWRRLTRAAWLAGAAAGTAMACGFFFQTQGLTYTTATNSAFITSMVVVIVPLLACIPGLRERAAGLPPWTAWMGALLAFCGVALLTTPAHTAWLLMLRGLNRGDLLTMICAIGFGLQIIALERGARHVGFQQLTLLQVGVAMVFLTTTAAISRPRMFTNLHALQHALAQPAVLFGIATAGILATALAFSIQTWAQSIIPATNIAVIVTLEPVFATLVAWLVLHEELNLRRMSGAALVLLGIVVSELLPRLRGATPATQNRPAI